LKVVFIVELSAEFENPFLKKFCVEHFLQIELKVGYPHFDFWPICRFENRRPILFRPFFQTKCKFYIHIWYHFIQEPTLNTLDSKTIDLFALRSSRNYIYTWVTFHLGKMLHIIINGAHTFK